MQSTLSAHQESVNSRPVFSVYTKPADPEFYPAGLANAVHLSCQRPGEEKLPLNRDYGILFAGGTVSPGDTIVPAGVSDPVIFVPEEGGFGIYGRLVDEAGIPAPRPEGDVFLWKTRDFIHFDEIGPVPAGSLSGYPASGHIPVEESIAEEAVRYWTPIRFDHLALPEKVSSPDSLDALQPEAVYSDGSRRNVQIDWNKEEAVQVGPGEHEIKGTIRHQTFHFPLAKGYGDPVIFPWEGKWYFLGTNDNLNDIGLYVRQADTVDGLFAPDTHEHLILPFDPFRGFEQTFWAPEFHVIGGEAYILFAVSGHAWGPQCHLMKLKKGGCIIHPEDWENPVRVVRKDGSPLSSDGITLDMTCIQAQSGTYMVWSYRRHIGTPRDTGSMLYIARVSDPEPWRLISDPVLLTRPLYGWENVAGTINNEGPYAFIRSGKVYLAYSGGSANSYTYALGLLTADSSADLTDLRSWTKSIQPVLTFRSVEGEYGPGHHSFFTNSLGELMIAYHAETDIRDHLRCDGIRRVHFREDGSPYFQMSAEDDLPETARQVSIRVITADNAG